MPVKSDINGNIQVQYTCKMITRSIIYALSQRLQARYDSAPDQFPTLQSIVDSEIAASTSRGSKSCTIGLLWLKRYIYQSSYLGRISVYV